MVLAAVLAVSGAALTLASVQALTAPERTSEEIPAVSGSGPSADCAFSPGFEGRGLDSRVEALIVFDDGSGPALYAGGEFEQAGTAVAHGVARWDGTAWSALEGPGGSGVAGTAVPSVFALAVYDDGGGPALYAGGRFVTAGGVTVNSIARWDGTAWSALTGPSGTGVAGRVEALAVFDDGSGPALYVGGDFATAGGVAAPRMAKWDGSAWSAVGTGTNGLVAALAVHDDGGGPALYAGGRFSMAGGTSARRVARWDGGGWSALSGPSANGVDGDIEALAVYDDGDGAALYAAGSFFTAGGVTANKIARWDGSAWSALIGPGNGLEGLRAHSLAVYDDGGGSDLYVGGLLDSAGGVTVADIARWDGTNWSALTAPSDGPSFGINAMLVHDDGSGAALWAGGGFWYIGEQAAGRIATWDGVAWSPLAETGAGLDGSLGTVYDMISHDDGSGPGLYAVGELFAAGGTTADFLARWNGATWSALDPPGEGLNAPAFALAVYDDGGGPDLYVGGLFTQVGGVPHGRVARWDGTGWSSLSGPSGTGTDGDVYALAVYDDGTGPALYAAGTFLTAGGVVANSIAKWDGTAWSALTGPAGTGVDNQILALAVYDDGTGPALYVGGDFNTAGGVTVSRIAKWNGSAWSALTGPLGTGTNGRVRALAVHEDPLFGGELLYVGGDFAGAGGRLVENVASWDGSDWRELFGPQGFGTDGDVWALEVLDDGDPLGPVLYAAGEFTTAGGLTANRIARWDGLFWSVLAAPAGIGMNTEYQGSSTAIYALASHGGVGGPALYAGGDFGTAGGLVSRRIAEWSCVVAVFADGFESGDVSAWSGSVGGP